LCPVIFSAGLRDAEIGVRGWDTGGYLPYQVFEPLGGCCFAGARSLQIGPQALFDGEKTISIAQATFAGGSHAHVFLFTIVPLAEDTAGRDEARRLKGIAWPTK